MDRAFARIKTPVQAPDPEPTAGFALLREIRDLLKTQIQLVAVGGRWNQDVIDLAPNVPWIIRAHPGRKSIKIFNAGAGAAYVGEYPHVTALSGMPILANAERELNHEAEIYCVSPTGCRLIFSEEWEA